MRDRLSALSHAGPSPGDVALCCAHIDTNPPPEGSHWWKVAVTFRADGDAADREAQWFVACDPCFRKCGGNVRQIEPGGDFTVEEPITIRFPN